MDDIIKAIDNAIKELDEYSIPFEDIQIKPIYWNLTPDEWIELIQYEDM